MANIIFAERENARPYAPNLMMRQRLKSAPEKLLKSPWVAKTLNIPVPSGRKALGAINKKVSTPAVNAEEKKRLKLQETKVKHAPHAQVEEYAEIEKFIPYDPLEFEKYSIPEDLVPLGDFALPGLAGFSQAQHLCEEDLEMLAPLPNLSPVKMPGHSELTAFLKTLEVLTIDLPPEPVTD